MTKIALISDLHNELLRETGHPVPDIRLNADVDVLVLAGNIDIQEQGARYAVKQSQRLDIPVIYVLGNHEFYGTQHRPVIEKVLEETHGTDVTILDAESVVIADTLFIGATLWTDLELFGSNRKNQVLSHAALNSSDFDNIRLVHKPFSRAFTPSISCFWHEEDRAFIEAELAKDYDGKKVVISHHAPSRECLSSEEQEDLLSACHASHLDWMIDKYQPEAWLYGHTHYPNQLQRGKTTVINNPAGNSQQAQSPEYYESLVMKI